MTAKESKAVAWRWQYYGEPGWNVSTRKPVGDKSEPLVPESALHAAISLLAEAESRERGLMELCGARFHEIASLTKERDSLQSRLDAVVAAIAKHRDTFPDEALPSELELWESIAALGCATTGEGGE